MRFDIGFTLMDSHQNLLPINYQYPLSAWIYKTLELINAKLSAELHDKGYQIGKKRFKMFTFSNLRFPNYGYEIVKPDRLRIKKNRCWLTVSLVEDEMIHSFILGIFKEVVIRIGDKYSQVPMQVFNIQRLDDPEFEEGKSYPFQTLSPICVSERVEGNRLPQYLSPEDAHFERAFVGNLLSKYRVMQENDLLKEESVLPDDWQIEEASFRLLGPAKRKLITIKDHTPQRTRYRAYAFNFELKVPKVLLQVGYEAGFGEKNSMGFGCCKVVNDRQ